MTTVILIANGEEALIHINLIIITLQQNLCITYNMQMKIIVEEEKDFNSWMAQQTTFVVFHCKNHYGADAHHHKETFITKYIFYKITNDSKQYSITGSIMGIA